MISGRTNVYGIFGFPVEHTFRRGCTMRDS